jgi:hypothetical protein
VLLPPDVATAATALPAVLVSPELAKLLPRLLALSPGVPGSCAADTLPAGAAPEDNACEGPAAAVARPVPGAVAAELIAHAGTAATVAAAAATASVAAAFAAVVGASGPPLVLPPAPSSGELVYGATDPMLAVRRRLAALYTALALP